MTASNEETSRSFRQHLPDLSIQRFTQAKKQDPYEYTKFFQDYKAPPWLWDLVEEWKQLWREPYKGVTNDGNVRPNLFEHADEGVPIEKIVEATEHVLSLTTSSQREKLVYPSLDVPERRRWSNPEFLLNPFGLRLEEVSEELALSILAVLQATLSRPGYEKAIGAMRINHFLGELVELPHIMNKYSYNFLLFGKPSTTEPWGYSFYGHHFSLNVFLRQRQIVISPTFVGAEPNLIDTGEFAGTRILNPEEGLGLKLMQSLTPELQSRAQIYKLMKDPAMPPGRWNKDDQRHMCGASRDNRVVPYEGILVGNLSAEQQEIVLQIVEQFVILLPDMARQKRLEQVQKHLSETYFSWIGGYEDTDPFYYRIQGPTVICEFDHHTGVFLTNEQPAKFHTHTILRTPNRGDYGYALL